MSKPNKFVKLPLTWNIDILKSVEPARLRDRFTSLCTERLGYDFGLTKQEVEVIQQCVTYQIEKLHKQSTFARELEFKSVCHGNGKLYPGLCCIKFITRKASRYYTLRVEGKYTITQ